MTENNDRYTFRLPKSLKDQIRLVAFKLSVPQNQWIVAGLTLYLEILDLQQNGWAIKAQSPDGETKDL